MLELTGDTVRRRYLLLRGLRWLPSGLFIPVLVLMLTDRGFSLAEIGIAATMQGLLVLALELPTGGLADAVGRRTVLVAATALDLVALLLFALVADTLPVLMAVWALEGVYRALESGPLDAWYVDAARAADPYADIETGLARAGGVIGVAIAAGSVLASAIVALSPFPGVDPLVGPLLVAAGLRAVEAVALGRLMVEVQRPRGATALLVEARRVPAIVREAVHVVRSSKALLALVAVEVFWGFGMTTWETLLPPHLGQVMGDTDAAGRLLGPVVAVAWLASGAAAVAVPALTRRTGPYVAGALMRVAQGATVVLMGLAGGVVGVVAGYLLTYAIHGASNPVHMALLHREVDADHRTTVLSVNSMVSMPAGGLGGILLGALADTASLPTAMVVGAAVVGVAAPLYLVARAHARPQPSAAGDGDLAAVAVGE